MLFMTIYTYEPKNRDEIIKRRSEGTLGGDVKIIKEWSSLAGGRVFRLLECDNAMAMVGASLAWNDLGHIDVYPVSETDEILKAIGGGK